MTAKATEQTLDYIGDELELFEHAHNWKDYFANKLQTFISGDVAEVGAGLGGTTAILCAGTEDSWTCLEPDSELCKDIVSKVAAGTLPGNVEPVVATLENFDPEAKFDTIMYIDVLEHIEGDKAEADLAASRLKPGGRLIVLAPAHQSLYTPFDKAIGHYRRYSKASLKALNPAGLELETSFYLDSVGLLASLANKLFLQQSSPRLSQIKFWDNVIIPVSKVLDPLLMRSLGKTVIAVWKK